MTNTPSNPPLAITGGASIAPQPFLASALSVVVGPAALPAFLGSLTRLFLLWDLPNSFGLADLFRSGLPSIVVELGEVIVGVVLIRYSGSIAGRLWFGPPVKPVVAEPVVELSYCPSCGTPYDPADYRGGHFTPRCSQCNTPLDVRDT